MNVFHPIFHTVFSAVLMLYDHILTFPEEVAYAWQAPSSFIRNGFLFNKYMTVGCILIILHRQFYIFYTTV